MFITSNRITLKTFSIILLAMAIIMIIIASYTAITNYIDNVSRSSENVDNYIVVEDLAGRFVKVPANVRRIVAIGPGTLRLVAYLNALDFVVGVEEAEHKWTTTGRDYAMAYGDKLKNLTIIGPGGPRQAPDPEKIRAVKPDLVIMSSAYVQLYNPDKLAEEINASVIVVDYGEAGYLDLEQFKKVLRLLGKILDRETRAEELSVFIDKIVADLKKRTENIESSPSVYVGAVSYKGRQPFTSSQAKFPPLTLINTSSIADKVSNKPGFVPLDFEYILSMQPEIIFIDLNNLDVVIEDYSKDIAKYCSLKAFREGKIYSILPFNYYHTNVATALADAYYMGKIIYPDKFVDVDPEAKANEIFKMFLGRELYSDFVKGFDRGFSSLSDIFKCSK